MKDTLRCWATTSIALAGVGAIAITPINTSVETHRQVVHSAAQLAAIPNPIEYYSQVAVTTFRNAQDRIEEYFAAPFPIATAVIRNQTDSLARIIDSILALDVIETLKAVGAAVTRPVVNAVSLLLSDPNPFELIGSFVQRLAIPLITGVLGTMHAVEEIIEAAADLDVIGVFNAVINIPGRILNAVLNGTIESENDGSGLLTPIINQPIIYDLSGPLQYATLALQYIGETISTPLLAPLASVNSPLADMPNAAALHETSADSIVEKVVAPQAARDLQSHEDIAVAEADTVPVAQTVDLETADASDVLQENSAQNRSTETKREPTEGDPDSDEDLPTLATQSEESTDADDEADVGPGDTSPTDHGEDVSGDP
ncbi:hypothetical protein [Mycolicibacterium austroafricanum]|uniref:hypothetical protein n=1 Tax=Mycolicibacterium austroafricanum TaxID=39687 RepID=UPI001CA3484D|nr:hypothetical protein [Mycolicibacterium austroafricanum]QZT62517.1 hypothetical protein JN085_27225 [Mycolicibacterium austroafricanum]